MGLKEVEKIYQPIIETVDILQADTQVDYFDALIETMDNLLTGEVQVEAGHPSVEVQAQLKEKYATIDLDALDKRDTRLLMQLLLLQGYRVEKIQANHQMTPDTIGILVAYLIEKIVALPAQAKILDLGVGTANLLVTVLNQLKNSNLHGYGVDNDDTLLTLASIMVNLTKAPVELFHQDAMDPILVNEADLVIGDFPVGYYPIDEKVKGMETAAQEGHSYAHHLMIEKAVTQMKAGAWGIFVLPAGLFESKQAKLLLNYVQEHAYLQGMLNLPQELFQDKAAQKAILILQKKGGQSKQGQPILLGSFPSLKDNQAFNQFLAQIDAWKQANFK